ncbi:hypothetical protein DL93DRAFT_1114135 [Clavulina sp. PMI_390]|nr:hypothetical protein DL93DRAFT_1114135 [Clavulina sp. PMI_390]
MAIEAISLLRQGDITLDDIPSSPLRQRYRVHCDYAKILVDLLEFPRACDEFVFVLSYYRDHASRFHATAGFRAQLGRMLCAYSKALMGASRLNEALSIVDEAISLCRNWDIGDVEVMYCEASLQKSTILSKLGRFHEPFPIILKTAGGYIPNGAGLMCPHYVKWGKHQNSLSWDHSEGLLSFDCEEWILNAVNTYGDHLWSGGHYREAIGEWQTSYDNSYTATIGWHDKGVPLDLLPRLFSLFVQRSRSLRNLGAWRVIAKESQLFVTMVRSLIPQLSSHLYVELAAQLKGYGFALVHIWKHAEADSALEECTRLYHQITPLNPHLHRMNLATVLRERSAVLSYLGEPTKAHEASSEAVTIARHLHNVNPGYFRLCLAQALLQHGFDSVGALDPSHGISFATEAVDYLREEYSLYPAQTAVELSQALWKTAQLHLAAAQNEEAETSYRAVIEMHDQGGIIDRMRSICEAVPELSHHLVNLADALFQCGWSKLRVGRLADALSNLREAQLIYIDLTSLEEDGPWYRERLARTHLILGECKFELRSFAEARDLGERALKLFKKLSTEGARSCSDVIVRAIWLIARACVYGGERSRAREIMAAEEEALSKVREVPMYPGMVGELLAIKASLVEEV